MSAGGSSGGGEKFCLKWNEFESNMSTAFRELREDKDLFDVTLACEGKQVEAHKVILSACSPFFRSVLKRNPHTHPLLYLKGIEYEDVLAVLDFMYHGEVKVAQDDLNSFLAVGKELQVKGLTQDGETPSSTPEHPRPQKLQIPPQQVEQENDQLEVAEVVFEEEEEEVAEMPMGRNIKTEPETDSHSLMNSVEQDADTNMDGPEQQQSTFPKIVNTLSLGTEIKSDPDWDYHQPAKLTGPRTSLYRKDTYGHVKPHCKKDVDDRGACVICRLCGKRGRDMYNMREHIEAVHPHLSPVYHCKLCAQEFKSHNCLKVHTKKYH